MIVESETIDTAIAHHAVLLNRVQWLDPARADLQRGIWLHHIAALAGDLPGLLVLDDFADALRFYSAVPVHEVTVLKLIEAAIATAFARSEEALSLIQSAPNTLFYEALAKYAHKVSCADSPAAQEAADIWLDAEVEHTQIVLLTSGYDDDVTGPVIAKIEVLAETAAARPKPDIGVSSPARTLAEAVFDIDNYADMDD